MATVLSAGSRASIGLDLGASVHRHSRRSRACCVGGPTGDLQPENRIRVADVHAGGCVGSLKYQGSAVDRIGAGRGVVLRGDPPASISLGHTNRTRAVVGDDVADGVGRRARTPKPEGLGDVSGGVSRR